MRCAVLADVHGNAVALRAVLADAADVDAVWFLGDAVGVGPDPNECVALLAACGAVGVAGNHDRAALGRPGAEFRAVPLLRDSNAWTRGVLSDAARAFLRALPDRRVEGDLTLVHALPSRLPTRDDFAAFATPYCLAGHTHVPLCSTLGAAAGPPRTWAPQPRVVLELGPERLVANPGAVGVPGVAGLDATYFVYEPPAGGGRGALALRRVAYDLEAVSRRHREAGQPPSLGAAWERYRRGTDEGLRRARQMYAPWYPPA